MRAWLLEQKRSYFGNAGSVRDFRTQLRGNRAPIYFSLYLFVLFLFAIIAYAAIEMQGNRSVSELQGMLYGYYQSILATLEGLVILIAPILTATSIVSEHQRRSMELIQSSPVTPKYFFVGKLVSGYRYVWMLLALSLPVTATCVVLGGASWSEVLEAYLVLSLHALVFTAIALPIGMMANKAVGAVLWSLIAVGGYAGLANVIGWAQSMSAMGSMFMGGSSREMPPWIMLAPFSSNLALGTHCTLWGVQVPNWILAIGLHLIIVRLIILGAGSAMGRYGAAETKSLRIAGLVVLCLVSFSIAYFTSSTFSGFGMPAGGNDPDGFIPGAFYFILSLLLIPFVPHLLCWSSYSERKFGPDRPWVFRSVLKGGSGGGIPFVTLWMGLLALSLIGAWAMVLFPLNEMGLIRMGWVATVWLMIIAIARLACAYNVSDLDTARKIFVVMLVGWVLAPLPILIGIDTAMGMVPGENMYWALYAGAGLFTRNVGILAACGLLNIVIGGYLLYISEKKRVVRSLIEVSQLS